MQPKLQEVQFLHNPKSSFCSNGKLNPKTVKHFGNGGCFVMVAIEQSPETRQWSQFTPVMSSTQQQQGRAGSKNPKIFLRL